MQFLFQRTPIRQVARAYAALIAIPSALHHLAGAMGSPDSAIPQKLDLISGALRDLAETTRRAIPEVPTHDVAVHEVNGFRLLLDRSSLVDRIVIEKGEWEGEQVRYLMRLAEHFRGKSNPILLDLGSYWGHYSFMLYSTGIFEKIIAIDADAYNFSQLQANIFLNKLDHVITAYHAAVSDKEGFLTVQNSRTHSDGNRGATRVVSADEAPSFTDVRNVRSVAIDDLLQIKDAHLVIKMDVEAHEDRALRGMRKLIESNQVILQIEIYKEQTQSVVPVLEEMGLRQICDMYPDFFYTNVPIETLGY